MTDLVDRLVSFLVSWLVSLLVGGLIDLLVGCFVGLLVNGLEMFLVGGLIWCLVGGLIWCLVGGVIWYLVGDPFPLVEKGLQEPLMLDDLCGLGTASKTQQNQSHTLLAQNKLANSSIITTKRNHFSALRKKSDSLNETHICCQRPLCLYRSPYRKTGQRKHQQFKKWRSAMDLMEYILTIWNLPLVLWYAIVFKFMHYS